MDIVDQIVERRIAEAIERGEFLGLPGEGRPLELEEDPLVPPELRVGYRLLKNARFVPEEIKLRAEIRSVEQLLAQATDRDERAAGAARLRLLLERLGSSRAVSLQAEAQYFERLAERVGVGSRS